tara:strand:- start:126 stop:338 length:213 start_codon:yes stop_codon:yes gene_type:complete
MGIDTINLEKRILVDNYLLMIAGLNATLGKDSKLCEKAEVRKRINECLSEIKKIDLEFWEEIVPDKKDKI